MSERDELEKIGRVVDVGDQTVVIVGHLPGIERYIDSMADLSEAKIAKAERALTEAIPRALTSANVQRVAEACRSAPGEAGLIVNGVRHVFSFRQSAIHAHRAEIRAMLAELPHQFRAGSGGGWTFLNGCSRHPYTDDVKGEMWTGLHLLAETLFALGIAAELGEWLMPRGYWAMMPGGMPYYVVKGLA